MTQSRVGMTLGSTTRNGGDFEFKKISLSLERDLVPAENPIDAYRDINPYSGKRYDSRDGPRAPAEVAGRLGDHGRL